MKYFLTALLLLTACAATTPAINEGPLIEEIRRESALAKAEHEACQKYDNEARRATERHYRLPTHPTKADALQALGLLERRPLHHPHSDRVQKIYDVHFASLAKLPEPTEVSALYRHNVVGICAPFIMFEILTRLPADTKKFTFSKQEKRRIENVTRTGITEQVHVPEGLIYKAIQVATLKSYVEAVYQRPDKAKLLAEIESFLAEVEIERKKITAAAQAAGETYGPYSLMVFEYEQSVVRRLTGDHARLVAWVWPR